MGFLKEILDDINWRMGELASLKTLPHRYNMQEHHQIMLTRFAIPSCYSLWEGFVKNSFELYVRELNSMLLEINDCHLSVLTHALTSYDKLKLENSRIRFDAKKEFIEFYQQTILKKLHIMPGLPTKSNIDFDVANDILERFNLSPLPKSYEAKLKKLLHFRNSIAHGENSIPVTTDHLSEFTILINDLMSEIFNRIEDGIKLNSYRRVQLADAVTTVP